MVQTSNTSSNSSGADRVRLRNDARRLEILRAAARVFRRLGLSNAGMREIAQEAGLSPGNLYHYFAGKDELLLYCQERTLQRLEEAVERARASRAPAAERLRQILRGHVLVMLDEYEGATAHLEVEALPEAMRTPVIARRDAYERAIRTLISRGVAGGEFAGCDAALVTRAMLGAVNWSARWYRPDGGKSSAEIADALADYLVAGLAGGATQARRAACASTGKAAARVAGARGAVTEKGARK